MPGSTVLSDPYAGLNEELARRKEPVRAAVSVGFIAFMLVLALLFAVLTYWQLQRLDQKLVLQAAIDARATETPFVLPESNQWIGLPPETFDYRVLTVSGHFVASQTVLVFANLDQPRGSKGGPGYWVMTPLALDSGGTLLINRGFVPQDMREWYDGVGADLEKLDGLVHVTGIARRPEPVGTFTPGPDIGGRVEYVRNVDRLTALMDKSLAPFATFYLDAEAGPPDTLPQGGETILLLANRHFEYALTWGALCLLTIVMTVIWWFRRRSTNVGR